MIRKGNFKNQCCFKSADCAYEQDGYFNHLPVLKTHWELLPCNFLRWCNCSGCMWAISHPLLFQRADHSSLQLLALLFCRAFSVHRFFFFQESFLYNLFYDVHFKKYMIEENIFLWNKNIRSYSYSIRHKKTGLFIFQ